jgi:uncharacterized protein
VIRDRDGLGRPEQQRPRDRTGRPLPYGTTGVLVTEDHAPHTVADAVALAEQLWDQRRYFEAHECLEFVWRVADADDAELWQGIIQIAVAAVHLQRQNPDGARRLFARAQRRLSAFDAPRHGIDVGAARELCQRFIDQIDVGDREPDDIPGFPVVATGIELAPGFAAQSVTPTSDDV